MTLVKTSTIDLIGFDPDGRGDIAVRIAKCTWLDGRLVEREPHRSWLQAGDDIDRQMLAVNADLMTMGFAPVPDDDVSGLKAEAKRRWTKERVAAREARDKKVRDEEAAKEKARQEQLAELRAKQEKEEADRLEREAERLAAAVRAKLDAEAHRA